ncbi:MAG: protein kinase [Acidobacteriota bacterium]|nr:protein kinase [Acidobacteriota bacterium]
MQPGDRIGAYALVEELGAGGMGVVWRAHDSRLGRDVALKILPPHLAEHPSALVRFEREARGLASLSHPGIVSIFDLGEEGNLRYLVTELLNGQTLRDALRQGAMPWRRATEIGATIAESLAAAHAKGIIHRDLKPENVFLTTEGRVKILDFGLAKELAIAGGDATTQAHQTEPGSIMGTLGYVSPEQLRGQEADFASDVFSLGCILYEMLSGRAAFLRGNAADTIAAILTVEPPATTIADIPSELLRIVHNCLAKDRRVRTQSAKTLAIDLGNLVATRASEPLPSAAQVKPSRRMAIATIAAIALGAAGAFFYAQRRTPPSAGSTKTMSLAVLPFTAQPDQAYAGEGLADSLFRTLANVEGLNVRLHKTLGVTGTGHVLRGSLRTAGANSIVNAEIVDLADGRRIWHQQYTGAADNLLGIERRLSADVDRFVRRATGAPESRGDQHRATTVDAAAYREYLRGRHHWNKLTIEGFETALEHFEKSIDLDPTYALAYAGLADAYSMLGYHGDAPSEVMPKARAAAQRAIDLDPLLGEGYTSLGIALIIHEWKWAEGEEALRRGVALNPRYASAHHAYAVYLGLVGRSDEALREIEKANELDPLSLAIYLEQAWIHYTRNDIAKAIEIVEKAIRHDPRSPLARYELSWDLDQAGRYAEAIDSYEFGLRLEKKDTAAMTLLRDALRDGETDYLRQRLKLAEAAGESHTTLAAILLQLGENDAAMDHLERGYEKRERDMMYLKTSPTYAALRADARFQSLLKKIGFPE